MDKIPALSSFSPRKQNFMRWICKTNKKTKEWTSPLMCLAFGSMLTLFLLVFDQPTWVKPACVVIGILACCSLVCLIIETLAGRYNPIIKGFITFNDWY